MSNSKKVYRGYQLISFMMIFFSIYLLGLSCFIGIIAFAGSVPDLFLCILSLLCFLFTILIVLEITISKIIIEHGQIKKISMFQTKVLEIKKIKTFEVCVSYGRHRSSIAKKDLDKRKWFGQKLIRISDRDNRLKKKFTEIRIPYLKALYEQIEYEIKQKNTPSK